METTIRTAAPLIFAAASVCLFLDAGLFSTPANNAAADRLRSTAQRMESSLAKGSLPSVQSVAELQKRRDALRAQKNAAGTLAAGSGSGSLQAILTEWGYQADDAVALSLARLRDDLADLLGPEREEAADVFVCDMARKIGQADLFTALTIGVTRSGSPERPPPRHPQTVETLRIVFSFVAGVGEAVEFIETWGLDPPSGVLLRPEKISLRRVDPALWGASLKFYSSPPIRADLSVLVVLHFQDR